MCTALAWNNGSFYFGRNMDLEYHFGEQAVIVPRGYPISFQKEKTIPAGHYAMVGMAAVTDRYPLFAEAGNEKGLCAAGLNFPGYAFQEKDAADGKYNITAYEVIPWLLAQCQSVEEAKGLLSRARIVAIPFQSSLPLPTLHFMVSDQHSSIVFEYTRDGGRIFENPFGVMTNSPTFDFHLANLANYINCTPAYPKNSFASHYALSPLGVGAGGFGIPGDVSTTSRFVRAVFHKLNSVCGPSRDESLAHFFHILDSVAMLKGSSLTQNGDVDLTLYSSCIDTSEFVYYYKTYGNSQLSAVHANRVDLNVKDIFCYPLREKQSVYDVN